VDLLEDRDAAAKLGKAARRTVKQGYRVERAVAAMREVLAG
jgi:hypothetical protein